MFIVFICVFTLLRCVRSDYPVHCLWDSLQGTWDFTLTVSTHSREVVQACDPLDPSPMPYPVNASAALRLTFEAPNLVRQGTGGSVIGQFTMIYDQGVEFTLLNQIQYFVFFNFTKDPNGTIESHCHQTFTGWFHPVESEPGKVPTTGWGCLRGKKLTSDPASHVFSYRPLPEETRYDQFLRGFGTKKLANVFRGAHALKPGRIVQETNRMKIVSRGELPRPNVSSLPTEFDWAKQGYVSPVRDQEHCGSCYAFGATAMFEARARIQTQNAWKPIFSPQDIVDCSLYTQGCSGGFPYLVSRWGGDFGIVEETCDPYVGKDQECKPHCEQLDERTFIYNVNYIGGFYGACTPEAMMTELYNVGPIAVSFEVYDDLRPYKSGVYQHKELLDDSHAPGPHWELTNHVVLITGWGVENETPYWKVKNSWGADWGDAGYFKIIRGVDNCAIESMAMVAVVLKPSGAK